MLDLFRAGWIKGGVEAVFEDEERFVLAVGWAVELGLDVDAGCGGEGEAMANVGFALGRRCQRRLGCIDGWSVSGFDDGVGWFCWFSAEP